MYYRKSSGNSFSPVSRNCTESNGKVVEKGGEKGMRVYLFQRGTASDHFKELRKSIFLPVLIILPTAEVMK